MIGISFSEGDLAAFDPYKQLLALIRYQAALLEFMLLLISQAWGMKTSPLPDPHFYYLDNEGVKGYREIVIPPRFELSPFFSRARY